MAAALFARKICDENVVLYRRQDGAAVALEDACWHRLLPLSLGRLARRRGGLRLSRAGLQFGRPLQLHAGAEDDQPLRLRARLSRGRAPSLVWIWPGDPALADPAKLPDFHWNDGTEWVGEGGTFFSLKCDYRLVVDNLMDLTHETYVHAGSIGDEAILEAPFEATHDDRTATLTRWMIGIEPPPFWAKQLGKPGPVDRWQIVRFEAPAVVVGDVGVAPTGTGAPQGDRSPGRQRRLPRRAGAGDGDDLPLLLEFRAHLPPRRRGPDARAAESLTSTTATASTTRTIACWRRSSARSSKTRASRSTTSTSTPARFGRGG